MTLANRITLLRLMLIPVFVVCVMSYSRHQPWVRYLALGVYFTAAISDCLDGFIARAYNQKTKLGAVLDPLADKLFINIAFVVLAVNDQWMTPVPYWFPVIILSRDVLIVIGAYLINEYFGPVRIRPRITGKITTVCQNASIIAVLLEVGFAYTILAITLIMTVVSFIDYMYAGSKQVRDEEEA